MIQDNEDNFPRGGKKVSKTVKRKSENDTLFGNAPKKQKKEKKLKVVEKVTDNEISLTNTKMLSRQSILEGMTILACIKKITDNALEVELPGLIIAKVMIDSISENLITTLKKALSSSSDITSVTEVLNSFFHCGQYVPMKVKSVQFIDDRSIILGSISPKDVNRDRIHNSFRKGELVWATVVSELDHGYQLDCNVANCRIFLPSQSIDENRKLEIGQPIWCKVHRVDSDNSACTLRVGIKRQHIDSILTDDTIPLNIILPGTKVEVYVERVAKNGIYGKFLDNFNCFIHESQLYPVMKSLNSMKEASMICAYLLCVENITKIAHMSMRSLDSKEEQVFERGTKVSGKVIGRNELGVYLLLNDKVKGWISNKRILRKKNNTEDVTDEFSKGSKHQCVVLGYNHMDRVHICGVEKDLLNEKYFSPKDLKVGDLVEGKIEEIKKNGIVVVVGLIKCFIPNIHLTDAFYSDNLKKKFVVGKKVRGRVFCSNDKTVILTLKTHFIKNSSFFNDLKDAKANQIYPALVLKAKPHGLVITFYNNIEGYVAPKEYNFQVTEEYRQNPSSFFFSGQVVKVRVIKVKGEKVAASLKLEESSSSVQSLEIGTTVKGIVVKKEKNGLIVFLPKANSEGFLPVEHLSIDSSLCQPMLETFNEEDKISDLMILRTDETGIIVSRREAIAYERCDLKVPKFQNIKKNTVLRCWVESVEKNGIFVSSPIKHFNKKIFIKKKNITKEKSMPKFEIHQGLLAKVTEVDRSNETIELSLKSEVVFDKNVQNSISLFNEYLEDEERLRKYGCQNGRPINKYGLCETVLCTVVQSTNKGCLVELPNGCKGLVVPSLSTAVKKGDKVEGLVLGHNYQLNYVELCLNPTIMKTINSKQDGVIPEGEPFFAVNKLLTREQYILAVTRKSANRQLVYLPLRLCENDPNDHLKKYYENDTFKVDICGKYGEKLIGFHRKLKYSLDYKFILKNTNWSEFDSSLLGDEVSSANTTVEDNGTQSEAEIVESDDDDDDDVVIEENKENEEEDDDDDDVVIEDKEEIDEEDDDVEMEDLSDTNKDSGVYSNSVNGKSNDDSDSESEEELESSENCTTDVEDRTVSDQIDRPRSIFSSVSNFFSTDAQSNDEDSSSEDEDGAEETNTKKKLTAAEKRAEKIKREETKDAVDKIQVQEVESAEHYEKLIMNNPNSSTLWLKYIAFSLSNNEYEKARTIGKRALSSINMTCEEDKFNIWMALLSIENLNGTEEAFEKVFEEAVQHNDAFKVYTKVTDLLFSSGKLVELEQKITKMRKKFKQEPGMWIHVAKLYYLMGNFKEARNMKNMCLKSITIKKEQYNLILKFAILEFNHGEIETGCLIFESVLVSYPNKTGAWLVYIDQLISKKKYTDARDVLNRAIALPLPIKSIKVIYHKYRTFEEKYGTPQTLAAFKEKAKNILQEKIQQVS